MKNFKEIIPNVLTVIRIILTPLLIILSLLKMWKLVIIFVCIGAITDFLDGKLARLFKTTSVIGAKLDTIADKVFAIGLIMCLISRRKSFIIILLLELIIASTNLYYNYKTKKVKSLKIGKFKTVVLFITIISAFISILNKNFINLTTGLIYATINLQVLSIIEYFCYYLENMKKINNYEEKTLEKTIKIDNLVELAEQYGVLEEEKKDNY
jgi:cardiolipin synthase